MSEADEIPEHSPDGPLGHPRRKRKSGLQPDGSWILDDSTDIPPYSLMSPEEYERRLKALRPNAESEDPDAP